MGVLDGVADGREELEPRARVEPLAVAVLEQGHAGDQLHDEVGPALVRRAGVEHARDVRVVHHRQRLPLRFEARDDLARVHAELDDLQRHAPRHRLHLLRHPHRAEAALADLLEELVGTNAKACGLHLGRTPLLDGRIP